MSRSRVNRPRLNLRRLCRNSRHDPPTSPAGVPHRDCNLGGTFGYIGNYRLDFLRDPRGLANHPDKSAPLGLRYHSPSVSIGALTPQSIATPDATVVPHISKNMVASIPGPRFLLPGR